MPVAIRISSAGEASLRLMLQAQVVHERQVARVELEREREADRERERRAEPDDRGADVEPERDSCRA